MRQNKPHDENLNHTGFLAATLPPEEGLEHQETFDFKEAIKIKYKPNFNDTIEYETKNHASIKN